MVHQKPSRCLAIVLYASNGTTQRKRQRCECCVSPLRYTVLPPFYRQEERFALVPFSRPHQIFRSSCKETKTPNRDDDAVRIISPKRNHYDIHSSSFGCCRPPADIMSLPQEILSILFRYLPAQALLNASMARRNWKIYSESNLVWEKLCQSRWQVNFNEIQMPVEYYADPKKMYKFMSIVWKRVRRACRAQQRVSAIADRLNISQTSAQEIQYLLCDAL